MICQECGSKNAARIKHIPRPAGKQGWTELVEYEYLCASCVRAKSEQLEILLEAARKQMGGGRTNERQKFD